MNITDSKFHVYAQNGMLLKRIDFSHLRVIYGDPICCSNNGKVLVFRFRNNYLRYMHSEGLKELAKDKAMAFTLIQLDPTGLSYMKQVNVYKGIRKCFKNDEEFKKFKKENSWLYTNNELLSEANLDDDNQ